MIFPQAKQGSAIQAATGEPHASSDECELRPIRHRGFLNAGQTCYMNASLQSLLTLPDLITQISQQSPSLRGVPGAELITSFADIISVHQSEQDSVKLRTVLSFKAILSSGAPEFNDQRQKDAHEFLTAFLQQLQDLSPRLKEHAPPYRCPVQQNLVFQMNSSRTCQRCGVRSQREEMFTSLCLDVFLDATVEQLLQDYQQTVPVDYACRCGSNKSIMASTFHTLPQNLILQLKRFKTATMEKRHDAVHLSPELQVPTHLSDRFYRLVSIISHSGTTPDSGHYRSFGLHPDQRGGQRWLCYDDNIVSATRGPDVFRGVQETAYVLFYQKQRTC